MAGDIETRSGDTTLKQQVFLIDRSMRLLENFTGFLLDVQEPLQSIHVQRGDEIDLHSDEITFGARGSARWHTTLFDQKQELELGYFARGDKVHGTQQRIEAATGIPYLTETDLDSNLGDLGVYVDSDLRATKWLAFSRRLARRSFHVRCRRQLRGAHRVGPIVDESADRSELSHAAKFRSPARSRSRIRNRQHCAFTARNRAFGPFRKSHVHR